MSEFRISVQDFNGAPTFDIRASGEKVRAVEVNTVRGLFGSKLVYTFETDDACGDLQFTIKKARGDIDIDLPDGWDVELGCVDKNDYDIRMPKVKVHQADKHSLVGYVSGQELTVHFYREFGPMGMGVGFGFNGFDGNK